MLRTTIDGKIGFGLMGFTWRPEVKLYEEFAETVKYALGEGNIRFLNLGEFYGNQPDHSEDNLKYIQRFYKENPEYRAKALLLIKGGCDLATVMPASDVAGIGKLVDNILLFVGDKLDFFEPARIHPALPVEQTVQYLKDNYLDKGKIGALLLLEVGAATILKADAIYPVSAVEVEFSLWLRDILLNGVFETCGRLGIPIVCYLPLGRGFLTGSIKKVLDIPKGDMRAHMDRFQDGAFERNIKLVEDLTTLVDGWNAAGGVKYKDTTKAITLPQVALAWIIHHLELKAGYPKVLPIPGGTSVAKVKENFDAQFFELSAAQFDAINQLVELVPIDGGRYNDAHKAVEFA